MSKIISLFFDIFRFHKKKIFALLLFTLFFALVLFPLDDLTDLMTIKVSELSNNRVYMQADGMGLHFLPNPGIKLSSVLIQAAQLPNINADELAISPSVPALLRGAIGTEISATGLFKGNVDVSYEEAEKNKSGERNRKIKIGASDIALQSLSQFLRDMNFGDYKLQGALGLNAQAKIDPSFTDPPQGQVDMDLKNFIFPPYVFYYLGAPMLSLPELKFKKSVVKANLTEGKVQIDDITLGDDKDDLSGKIHGELHMNFSKDRPAPDFGAYSLNIELKVQQKFYDQNSTIFALINSSYKKPMPGGQKFSFKISGDNFMSNPRWSE